MARTESSLEVTHAPVGHLGALDPGPTCAVSCTQREAWSAGGGVGRGEAWTQSRRPSGGPSETAPEAAPERPPGPWRAARVQAGDLLSPLERPPRPGRTTAPQLGGGAPGRQQRWSRNLQCRLVHPERRLRWPPAPCPLWDKAARRGVPGCHCSMLPGLLPLFSEVTACAGGQPRPWSSQGCAARGLRGVLDPPDFWLQQSQRAPPDAPGCRALPPAPPESTPRPLTAACSPGGGCGGGPPGRVGIAAQGGLQCWQPLGTAQPGMESCQLHPAPH